MSTSDDEREAYVRQLVEDGAVENGAMRFLLSRIDSERAKSTGLTNELANLKQCWEQQCAHVVEAIRMLGVDVSVETGEIPDSWTLVKYCDRVGKQFADTMAERFAVGRLLAVINRDGGHHAAKIGHMPALAEALETVAAANCRLDELIACAESAESRIGAAIAAEREACARTCADQRSNHPFPACSEPWDMAVEECAAAIRSRSEWVRPKLADVGDAARETPRNAPDAFTITASPR